MSDDKKKWYQKLGIVFRKIDTFGMPITLNFNKGSEFKTATGGIFTIILYSIITFVVVYLFNKVSEGKSIEISESLSENENIFSNQTVFPFQNNKFNVAFQIDLFSNNST